jgi:predicted GTPase
MRKLKLPKNARIKDVVTSAPTTTHGGGVRSAPTYTHISKTKDVVRSTPKSTHPNRIKNLGKFAHPPSKLPKTGVTLKAKRKSNKVKGSY